MQRILSALLFAFILSGAPPVAAAPDGKWFEEAYAGNRIAQRHIAEGFEKGINGFPKSLLFAYRWYALAALNDDKAAKAGLERVTALLSAPAFEFAQSSEPVTQENFPGLNSRFPGAFSPEFADDLYSGDLDGYLLIGSLASGSVDGAYLPRNYDNEIPGQNPDLPLRRD